MSLAHLNGPYRRQQLVDAGHGVERLSVQHVLGVFELYACLMLVTLGIFVAEVGIGTANERR